MIQRTAEFSVTTPYNDFAVGERVRRKGDQAILIVRECCPPITPEDGDAYVFVEGEPYGIPSRRLEPA